MDIKAILHANKLRLGGTFLLILLETLLGILFPLFMGYAVDGAIKSDYVGTYQLGALGIVLILVGSSRRWFDSRLYAKIYRQLSSALMSGGKRMDVSQRTARLNMLTEVTEFFENQIPALVQHSLGLIGVSLIIWQLNLTIFLYAIGGSTLVMLVYWLSSKKTINYHEALNNEMEVQVEIISQEDDPALRRHVGRLTGINVQLSDLETLNYALSWLFMILFLLFAIVTAVAEGIVQYGALFALIMYVYQFIESITTLPLYYQQWLRLREISSRLNVGF